MIRRLRDLPVTRRNRAVFRILNAVLAAALLAFALRGLW